MYENNFLQYINSMPYTFGFFVFVTINAYICCITSYVVQSKLDHLNFQEQLSGVNRRLQKWQQKSASQSGETRAQAVNKNHGDISPQKNPDGKRKKCILCLSSHERFRKTRIQWWCPNCKVGLCVEGCFRRYHTRLNYED